MKHEYVHRNRLSIDIDKDAKMAKQFFDHLCLSINQSSKIKGYIRELHSDPFGYILLSELQVLNNFTLYLLFRYLEQYFRSILLSLTYLNSAFFYVDLQPSSFHAPMIFLSRLNGMIKQNI